MMGPLMEPWRMSKKMSNTESNLPPVLAWLKRNVTVPVDLPA